MAKKTKATGHDIRALPIPFNRCFACGPQNRDGMRLKFHFDEPNRRSLCSFRLPRKFEGPPGHAHGGIIATILDEAMGKVNRLRSVVALTSEMRVQYLKPVPLAKRLHVQGRENSVRGRKHVNVAEIRDESGRVLARGRATFIAVDPEKLFAMHLKPRRR